MAKTALVLSGGGMFGAWQAGAWRALEPVCKPELVVGASVGSLNGYAIAAGWRAQELCAWWLRPEVAGFRQLPSTIQGLMAARPLQKDYAVVITDAVRMKAKMVLGPAVRAEHLLASCAVPGAMPPVRIDGRWYADGGLLNPLPLWAAVELGATKIAGLNVLAEIPSALLKPFVKVFRGMFGHNPPLPGGVELITLVPSARLGSMRDALVWSQDNAQRWLELGYADARKAVADHQAGLAKERPAASQNIFV